MSDDMVEDEHKRTANLARIRDNQRRSRARRKEYLSELEVKYRSCEETGAEASREIQQAARRVLDENKRLRELLKQQGLSDSEIDGFLTKRPENPQYPSATTVALESMIGQRRACGPGSACGSSSSAASRQRQSGPSHDLAMADGPQHMLHPGPYDEQSPRSTSSSSLHTPSAAHVPTMQPQPHQYTMEPLSHAHTIDSGMDYGDAYGWNPQYISPHTSTDSSSCYVAAEAIRTIKPDIGYDLEVELGCGDGKPCDVPNSQIFSIMDRYSGPIG